MTSVNLIPAPRLAARRRRTHLRRCAAGCVVWSLLSVAAGGASRAYWRDDDPQADERLAKVVDESRRTEKVIAAVRAELDAAESALRANEAIAHQPDWSILLALLAQNVGDEVVLKNCGVRPADPNRPAPHSEPRRTQPARSMPAQPAAPANVRPAPCFVFEASGVARSHAAANQFLLRLERTGLFSRVSLLDTAREPFLDREAIAFRLECALQERPADASTAAARGGE